MRQLLRSGSSLRGSHRTASSELRLIAKERLKDQALRNQQEEVVRLREEVCRPAGSAPGAVLWAQMYCIRALGVHV